MIQRLETLQDLIEEAKVRAIWWAICIFAISYFLSHTSKSMWMNVPISLLIAFALRLLANHVDFRWKVPPLPDDRQTYLSYLHYKQLSVNDPRLSTRLPSPKWKRKFDSPVVEAAVEEFIDKILRDFVLELWYTDITPDRDAPQLMRAIILDALGEVAGRVKEVNLVDLLTRDVVDLIGDHIELYRSNQSVIGADVMKTLSSEERDERLKHHLMASKQLHPALVSPECEYKFLQHLVGGLLALVLRPREAQCPLVRCMAREFVTCLVLQPLMNFASPLYINELFEYIFLSGMNIFKGMGSVDNCVPQPSHPSPSGTVESHAQFLGKHEVSHSLQTTSRQADSQNAGEKSLDVSETPAYKASFDRTWQPHTADWARVLDAATRRRTEILAPDNLENMWARGRHYKDKLNNASGGSQVTGINSLGNHDTSERKEPVSAAVENRTSQKGGNVKARVKLPPASDYIPELKDTTYKEIKQLEDLEKDLTGGPRMVEVDNTNDITAIRNKSRLKRSNSTSALINESGEKSTNLNGSKGLIVSEQFFSPHFGRNNVEPRADVASGSVIRTEGSQFRKLRCRVIGAYFEKVGSKSFAVYSVAVTDSENNTWFVKRRYRNFERLHRHLKDIPNYTLHLPPKRIFSSSTEDAFVHQRCIQLDQYLQDLLSIANVAEQHEVWDFFSISSKNYSFGRSSSVMKILAVNVDDAVDDIVRQFKGVSDGLMRKVAGSSAHSGGSSSMPYRHLSWNVDELSRDGSLNSTFESANSFSDNEVGEKDESLGAEAGPNVQANGWHSDNELDTKGFPPRVVKRREVYNSLDPVTMKHVEAKSEMNDTGRAAAESIFSVLSNNMEDPVGVPPEWTPPNVSVPMLNLVDKIFQLKRRGWIRRQVFWISKQILQLIMEDAIDDWLVRQINWLRRDDAIALGIRWVQDVLWPGGKFFLNLRISQGEPDETEFGYRAFQSTNGLAGSKYSPPGSFELQLEAARRASDVKKMIFNGAPTALVSLIGHKQYRRCARDIYYFLQSSICIKQLAYCMLELVLISVFPELKDITLDIHRKMQDQPA
ncbi:hypothetical protein Droror1_Dr00005611 [Drosera rotundifolia]